MKDAANKSGEMSEQAGAYTLGSTKESQAIFEEVVQLVNSTNVPETIYHYTNDTGLHGILKSGEIWLHDVYGLNDPTEAGHAMALAEEALETEIVSNAGIRRELKKAIHTFHSEGTLQANSGVFAASFSSKSDDLNQWRSYADNGKGFAVGFSGKEIEDAFMAHVVDYASPATFGVLYDDPDLNVRIRSLFEVTERYLIASMISPGVKNQAERRALLIHIASSFITTLYLLSTAYKNEAYKSESEYRTMYHFTRPIEEVGALVRVMPYKLIRYMAFPWRSLRPEALRTIVSGPSGGAISEKFANDVRRQYGYPTVTVTASKIPYRI